METIITTKGNCTTRIDQMQGGYYRLGFHIQQYPDGSYTMGSSPRFYKTLKAAIKSNEKYLNRLNPQKI